MKKKNVCRQCSTQCSRVIGSEIKKSKKRKKKTLTQITMKWREKRDFFFKFFDVIHEMCMHEVLFTSENLINL